MQILAVVLASQAVVFAVIAMSAMVPFIGG
jgi:hypothetical protein